MKEIIFKIVRHSGIYGIGNLIIQSVTVFLLPLYTTHLTPEDYAILQLCNIFSAILHIVFLLGVSSSLFKVYFSIDDKSIRQTVMNTALSFYIVFASSLTLILLLISKPLSKLILGSEGLQYVMIITILGTLIEGLLSLNYAIFRAWEKPLLFSINTLIRLIIYVFLNIFTVVYLKRNFTGIKESYLISTFLALMLTIPFTLKSFRFKLHLPYQKEMLQIGIPLAIAAVASWILDMTDRYMMRLLLPESKSLFEIGIYSLGDKIASLLKMLLVAPFVLAWGPLMYTHQNNPNAKNIFADVYKFFVFIAVISFMFVSIFGKEVLQLLSNNKDFYDAYKVVPILAMSKILSGFTMIFTVGLTLTKKTQFMAYSNYIAAGSNVALNFLLIPHFGMIGAASASLIAFFMGTTFLHYFAQKFYSIEYHYFSAVIILVIFFSISLIANIMNFPITFKILLVMLTPFVLVFFRFPSPKYTKIIYNKLIERFL